jgi:hypothetical protein
MIKTPLETLIDSYVPEEDQLIDNQKANMLKNKLALELREQLTIGVPTARDEIYLGRLREQLLSGKVVVKLFLRHQLHAKLYLSHRASNLTPQIGLLGSSNLTFAGLSGQGELNIDVPIGSRFSLNKLNYTVIEKSQDRRRKDT